MNGPALTFVLVGALALLLLPRRWAPLPLLVGACYMTVGQKIELGPFTFTVLRILIAVGTLRVIVRQEKLAGGWNRLDSLIVAWSVWACLSSLFHEDVSATMVRHVGNVYNIAGIYFLLRTHGSSLHDAVWLCGIGALVLVPVALAMMYEQLAFYNFFSIFGGVPSTPQLRAGRIRAFGPFAHPILAGTVGAVMLPLMIGVWRSRMIAGSAGILACLTIVFASASSGPVMSAAVGLAAVAMWPVRRHMNVIKWTPVVGYAVLLVVMERSPIYIMQRLEVMGGSTGWYRARLIESSFEHLDEWWLAGTDHTRHWMPDDTAISATHTDITNHYLAAGVMGGIPLVLLFIACLAKGFSFVGSGLRAGLPESSQREFILWTFGSSLAAHALTSISVSYFDQSFLFLYLTLAVIASVGPASAMRNSHAAASQQSSGGSRRWAGRSLPSSDSLDHTRRPGAAAPRIPKLQGRPHHNRVTIERPFEPRDWNRIRSTRDR